RPAHRGVDEHEIGGVARPRPPRVQPQEPARRAGPPRQSVGGRGGARPPPGGGGGGGGGLAPDDAASAGGERRGRARRRAPWGVGWVVKQSIVPSAIASITAARSRSLRSGGFILAWVS